MFILSRNPRILSIPFPAAAIKHGEVSSFHRMYNVRKNFIAVKHPLSMEFSLFNEKCRQTWAGHEFEQTTAPRLICEAQPWSPPFHFCNELQPLVPRVTPERRMHLDSSRLATSVPIPPFPSPVPGKRKRTVEIRGKEVKNMRASVFPSRMSFALKLGCHDDE